MHSSLVALLKKKYVYEDTLQELIKKYELTNEDVQEFYETYSGNIRSFDGDDENNIKFFIQDICKYPTLSPEEEHELLELCVQWNMDARDKLLLHMTGYVMTIAKKFTGFWLSLLDLVSEGMLWVEKALGLYKLDKSKRLSTYANSRIRNYMLTALAEHNGMVSLSLYTTTELKLIDNVQAHLFQQFNRLPTQDELFEAIQKACYPWKTIDKKKIIKLLQIKQGVINLWSYANANDIYNTTTIWDLLEDNVTPTPSDKAQTDAMKKNILYLIDGTMNERDASIIKMRFGIGSPEFTLEQIGKTLGVTRERIRQIEKRFLTKVKCCPQLNVFLS